MHPPYPEVLRHPIVSRRFDPGFDQLVEQQGRNELLLVAAALATICIVLGMLYESYIHPITILSTLPSARQSSAA